MLKIKKGFNSIFNRMLGPGRWFEFDTAGSVPWFAHESGLSGMTGGGFTEFQDALLAWVNEPNTPISLPYLGTTTATGGLSVFEDACCGPLGLHPQGFPPRPCRHDRLRLLALLAELSTV